LEFALSSLVAASDEQYKDIPNDEIALLARKFRALHKFRKERRRSPRGCFECGDTTHFITDCLKRKKFDSSNKYNYTNRNDSSNKGDNKKKYRFEEEEEVPKDHVLSVGRPERLRFLQEAQVQKMRLHWPLPHRQVFKKHL
jgi:hypothetical protein